MDYSPFPVNATIFVHLPGHSTVLAIPSPGNARVHSPPFSFPSGFGCDWDIVCDLLEIICDIFAKNQREFGPNSTGTLGTMYKYTFLTKNIFWKNFDDIFMKKISLAIFRMIKYQSCRYKNHTKKYNYLTQKYKYPTQKYNYLTQKK